MKIFFFILSMFIQKSFKFTILILKMFTFSKIRVWNSYKNTKKKYYLINSKYAHLIANVYKFAFRNWFKQIMKFNISIMTIDAIITINYKNLHDAIAINFVVSKFNFTINFAINSCENFNNSVSNSNINVEKILFANITIYDNINARIKFANIIENYSKL